MLPAHDLLPHIEPITGLDKNRTYAVYRALVESEMLPKSRGPNCREKIGSEHLSFLLIGNCTDVPIRYVPQTAKQYYDLHGSNGATAGHALASIIESFKLKSDLDKVAAEAACKMRFVIDIGGAPRITLSFAAGEQIIQSVFGPQGPQWADENVRKSVALSGRVIHDLAVGLHHGIWDNHTSQKVA
jgi:hypothetical protein